LQRLASIAARFDARGDRRTRTRNVRDACATRIAAWTRGGDPRASGRRFREAWRL